jgi:triacylglycerol lipase
VENKINLTYPVLLVHGAGFRDKMFGIINYWGRIPKYLENHGVTIFYGGTDSWGTIEKNAEKLKEKIVWIKNECKFEKIHIIAHSRGGLEARYAINELQMDEFVVSLTTISTPHKGTKIMNFGFLIPAFIYKFIAVFVNIWNKILGDKDPDFYTSSLELSEKYCTEFNKKYPNKEHIYYQSYASKLKYFFSDILFILLYPLLLITDGDSDGLCPVESAKWGDFKGTITTKGIWGISHCGIVDFYRIKYKGINILELYLTMIKDLGKNY